MIGPARRLQIEITANRSTLERDLHDARRKLRKFERDARRELGMPAARKRKRDSGGMFGNVGAMLGAGGIAGAALGVVGGLSGVASEAVDYERSLTRLQIAQGKTAAQMADMRDVLLRTSLATGIARNDLLSGVSAYQALTGDTAGAASAVELFGRVATASGATMDDVAGAAAALRNNLQIDPADFERAFDILITQGQAGAVELRDLAAELSSVAPQFTRFAGGSGVDGLNDLGAAFQVIRQGFKGPAEAATGLNALMTALGQNAAKFEKAGVRIFDKDPKTGVKTFRGFLRVVEDIGRSKLAGDPTALTKAFGSSEAERAFNQLARAPGMLRELIETSAGSKAVAKDFETYIASPAAKIEQAVNRLKLAFAEAFTPDRIERFAGAVMKAADAFASFVELTESAYDFVTTDDDDRRKMADLAVGMGVDPEEAARSAGVDSTATLVAKGLKLSPTDQVARAYQWSQSEKQWERDAGRDLAKRAGVVLPSDVVPSSFSRLQWQIQAAVERGMAQAQTTVQVGADTVVKAHKNAPSHRRRPAP